MTFWDVAPWIYGLMCATTLSGLLYLWDTTSYIGRPDLFRAGVLFMVASVLWPLAMLITMLGALFFWWRDWKRQRRTRKPKE